MEKIILNTYDYKDIQINDDVILHINCNDEGYSFDIYNKSLYQKENYDEGLLTGTWVHYDEIETLDIK